MINFTAINDDICFENEALKLFHFQATHCAPYRQYLELIDVCHDDITTLEEIPFLPIELFKSHKIYCGDKTEEVVFSSSGSGGNQSYHYVADTTIYEQSFVEGFRRYYGDPSQTNIYALLPSYLEREGSSLIYMINHLINLSCDGGFFLYDYDNLIERLERRDRTKKSFLFGVTFALMDLVERYNLELGDDVIVMETGGMKGRRRELPRQELHKTLCKGLGVSHIHSEYGMCELLSQGYSCGEGIFTTPPWMRVMIRSLGDPRKMMKRGRRGGINIIDLANIYSCSFIETQDKGMILENGSFTVEGRIDHSDIRGCNLLV